MANEKEYTIYTKWLALRLREQGFRLIRTGINPNFPQFITYVFEDNEDLHIAVRQLTNKNKNQ